jgi:hypothetical protein
LPPGKYSFTGRISKIVRTLGNERATSIAASSDSQSTM